MCVCVCVYVCVCVCMCVYVCVCVPLTLYTIIKSFQSVSFNNCITLWKSGESIVHILFVCGCAF